MAKPARSFTIEDLAHHGAEIAAELEAGNRLELIQGGKRIGEIIPSPAQPTEAECDEAWQRLLALLEQGIDLGGVPLTRDQMHER